MVKFSTYLNRRVFVMVIITNFVVVSSVGIKRVVCIKIDTDYTVKPSGNIHRLITQPNDS